MLLPYFSIGKWALIKPSLKLQAWPLFTETEVDSALASGDRSKDCSLSGGIQQQQWASTVPPTLSEQEGRPACSIAHIKHK